MAFLDLLIEASQDGTLISDEEIKEQVDTIMFEGHDTTAAASSYFLTLMGIHQDIQAKVVQELDEIFRGTNRPTTFNDTLEMKYLERCLLETLRLYPPVPIIGRQLNEDLKLGRLCKSSLDQQSFKLLNSCSVRELHNTSRMHCGNTDF